MTTEHTIIQTPDGEWYGTMAETPDEAVERLSRAWLVQRIGNLVRVVAPLRPELRPRVRGE